MEDIGSGAAEYTPGAPLLHLDQPRVIALKDGKFTYKFHFRRITADDWNIYFEGIHSSSRQNGQAQENTIDISTAGIDLVQNALLRVEGYAESFDISKNGWQQKVPPRHAGPLSWFLRGVTQSQDEGELPFDPERQAVRLDAIWSQTEVAEKVTQFKALTHFFLPPTAEDTKRYYRALSMTRVVGGSRKGTTIHPSRHRVLIELYDRLIHSVEGYAVAGQALSADQGAIRREMDAYHKTQAVIALFFRNNSSDSAEAEAA